MASQADSPANLGRGDDRNVSDVVASPLLAAGPASNAEEAGHGDEGDARAKMCVHPLHSFGRQARYPKRSSPYDVSLLRSTSTRR
jgi:hypothetical protein